MLNDFIAGVDEHAEDIVVHFAGAVADHHVAGTIHIVHLGDLAADNQSLIGIAVRHLCVLHHRFQNLVRRRKRILVRHHAVQ